MEAPLPDPMLRWFAYEHLPPDLQYMSEKFHDLALQIVGLAPPCAERNVALRKLLESKDAAVRAKIEGRL